MDSAAPTIYPELNELLADFVSRIRPVLGDDLLGAYVVGSFALGDGDESSDCDFLVVTARQVSEEQERALRVLHDEIPTWSSRWSGDFEGSYAPRAEVESLDDLGSDWLYVDRGSREMQWSSHCNVVDTRWILRERGIALIGPEPSTFACEVSGALLRDRMRELLPGFLDDLRTWASFDLIWTQRYIVETASRMLFTLETGQVESKRRSLQWGRQALSSEWHGLIEQALADRSKTWDDPADPDLVAASIAFAEYAITRAAG